METQLIIITPAKQDALIFVLGIYKQLSNISIENGSEDALQDYNRYKDAIEEISRDYELAERLITRKPNIGFGG